MFCNANNCWNNDSRISMSPKKPKSSRKRKNQNKNTSGESQQKVLVSDTQSDNTTFTIPRVTSLMNRTNMDFLHSTPQPQYTGQQGQQGQGQFSPYGPPAPQSQYSGYVSPIPPPAPSDLQSMVSALSLKMDAMNTKLAKLDCIDERLTNLERHMNNVTGELKGVTAKITEIEGGLTTINQMCEYNRSEIRQMKDTVKKLNDMSDSSNSEMHDLRADLSELQERHLDLQTRSMRDNLVFDGIPETNEEDPEAVLKSFLKDEMDLSDEFHFERVHRMGRQIRGKNRPIVAKFSFFKERETVRRAAPRALRGKSYGVNEQFPKEINDRRKQLIPHLKTAKRQNKRAVLKVDKLYIEDRLFIPDDGVNRATAQQADRNPSFSANARTSSRF